MLLPLLLSTALAAPVSLLDVMPASEVDAIAACPNRRLVEDPLPPCPAAEAVFDRVFVEGEIIDHALLVSVPLHRAFQQGLDRVASAADRPSVDADVAGVLRTLDRLAAADRGYLDQEMALGFSPALLDAYAALPGEVGPGVAAALDRPARTEADALAALEGGCRAEVAEYVETAGFGMLRPVVGAWHLDTRGILPMLVDFDHLTRRGELRCAAVPARARGEAPTPPAWGLVERVVHHGSFVVLDLHVDRHRLVHPTKGVDERARFLEEYAGVEARRQALRAEG